ncbi:YrbL family protein [Yoonia sp. 208BN28-4]|uniref:YrbL family protein n=1 Tax=Yoonia sp. 208BN28-4 TaxID=3126505 RepID=UPI0030AB1B38
MIDLNGQDPVAEGTQRWIYRHPHDPARLLKVLKPLADSAGRSALATAIERQFPATRTRWARKEYAEYTRVMLAHRAPVHLPISHLYGLAHTSRGLACVTDAVVENDALGPQLDRSLSDADLALLNDTLTRLRQFDIRASDITPRNFVFGQRSLDGQTGPRECVLVDGFGDIHAIPVRSWGQWFNGRALSQSFANLARRLNLRWDATTQQITR